MKDNPPCDGCGKRTATCHPNCKDYKYWLEDHTRRRDEIEAQDVYTMSREHEDRYHRLKMDMAEKKK